MDTIVEEIFSAQVLLLATLSYAIGAIPFGLLLTKWKTGKNLQNAGSGNIGATNATRIGGPLVGGLTLFFDITKGFVPGWVAIALGGSLDAAMFCGFCAFVGHCFPVWLRFFGGKGVATALGVLLLSTWSIVLYSLLGFVVGYLLLRKVAAGSMVGALCGVVSGIFILDSTLQKVILVVMLIIIFVRHHENIRNMMSGKAY